MTWLRVQPIRAAKLFADHFAQFHGTEYFDIPTVLQYVHNQFARIAIRHFQHVGTIQLKLALLLRMPGLLGNPARPDGIESQNCSLRGAA